MKTELTDIAHRQTNNVTDFRVSKCRAGIISLLPEQIRVEKFRELGVVSWVVR